MSELHPCSMYIGELDEKLAAWRKSRYGEGIIDTSATFRKLCEEIGELGEAMMHWEYEDSLELGNHVCEEAADVCMVLSHIARAMGGNLFVEVAKKLEVIEKRELKP